MSTIFTLTQIFYVWELSSILVKIMSVIPAQYPWLIFTSTICSSSICQEIWGYPSVNSKKKPIYDGIVRNILPKPVKWYLVTTQKPTSSNHKPSVPVCPFSTNWCSKIVITKMWVNYTVTKYCQEKKKNSVPDQTNPIPSFYQILCKARKQISKLSTQKR